MCTTDLSWRGSPFFDEWENGVLGREKRAITIQKTQTKLFLFYVKWTAMIMTLLEAKIARGILLGHLV